jgi:gamma-glutamyltranspeptidase/glutathione hydrolase
MNLHVDRTSGRSDGVAEAAPESLTQARSTHGMVASPHGLATEAGLKVLRDGGNAMEAAIAVGAVITVTCPHFCGIGGDAIWIIADRSGRKNVLMGLGQAVEHLPNFQDAIPFRGPGSTIVTAGAVDSWEQAHAYSRAHWRGQFSFPSLLDAAIGYAENGFPITASQLYWLDFRKTEVDRWPNFCATFMPNGHRPKEGESFAQPNLAHSLKAIARHGAREFYEGELAARIAKGLEAVGSPVTANDLRKTRSSLEQPVSLDYRGFTLLAPPPPTQGISTLAIMGVLREFDLGKIPEGSADYYHLCVEAVKQAFLDRPRIADPNFTAQPPDQWLVPGHLKRKAQSIKMDRALDWPHPFKTGDTVYFAVTDRFGHSVSVLQSTYYDWGSGIVVGDTGILWQNRGAAFSLDPRSPNVVRAGKRPFYTLNPSMVLKEDTPYALCGTQGADGQPQTLAVLLTRLLNYRLDPQEALARPRFLLGKTFSDQRDSLKLEASVSGAALDDLARRGHSIATIPALSPLAGQAGAIVIQDDGTIKGAHDPRGDGCAMGL